MRKKATRKRPYFTMESAMTAILHNASGKMHHGILFAPPLGENKNDQRWKNNYNINRFINCSSLMLNLWGLIRVWCCSIFKKGSKQLAANYRPISLTCTCSKIMEHIMVSNIMHYFDQHQILSNLQHRFREGHSCDDPAWPRKCKMAEKRML